MSMIIKGINLPEEVGNVISITLYDKKDNWLDNIEVYRKDVIDIPTPHGRLVDGDRFIELNECCGWIEDMTVEAFNELTPTILEAE